MLKAGDIVPCYVDWNSPNPKVISCYGKLLKLIKDDIEYEIIHDEMSENKQYIYYRQIWLVEVGTRLQEVQEYGITKQTKEVVSQQSIKSFCVLKQIGIHSKTTEEENDKIRNKYSFTEGSIAKMKNIITNDVDIVKINSDDMERIYRVNSTEYIYKPIRLNKKIRHLINNKVFKFDFLMRMTFETISCADECPLKWKPEYVHQAQIIYESIIGKPLNVDLCELKKILLKK